MNLPIRLKSSQVVSSARQPIVPAAKRQAGHWMEYNLMLVANDSSDECHLATLGACAVITDILQSGTSVL
jgi:hypothetical protein